MEKDLRCRKELSFCLIVILLILTLDKYIYFPGGKHRSAIIKARVSLQFITNEKLSLNGKSVQKCMLKLKANYNDQAAGSMCLNKYKE